MGGGSSDLDLFRSLSQTELKFFSREGWLDMICLLRFEDAAVDAETSFILAKEQLRLLKAVFHPRW